MSALPATPVQQPPPPLLSPSHPTHTYCTPLSPSHSHSSHAVPQAAALCRPPTSWPARQAGQQFEGCIARYPNNTRCQNPHQHAWNTTDTTDSEKKRCRRVVDNTAGLVQHSHQTHAYQARRSTAFSLTAPQLCLPKYPRLFPRLPLAQSELPLSNLTSALRCLHTPMK